MKWRKREEGSILVLATICLSVLLGMGGFAIDFGTISSTKQKMQNAVDAAALAGASDLMGGKSYTTVCNTATQYTRVNGFDPSEEGTSIEVKTTGTTVTVTLEQEVKMGFTAVLTGQNQRVISVSATAEYTTAFGTGKYALFAGEKIEDGGSGIVITGNSILIDGNIHSNSDIRMPNATLGEGAVATAVHSTNPSTKGWNAGALAIDMPSINALKEGILDSDRVVTINGNVTKKAKDGFQSLINDALASYATKYGSGDYKYRTDGLIIYIDGSLTFNGNSSTNFNATFPIILIVKGDIDLNGATLNSTVDDPMVIISETGDITVNGGGATYSGILFAPRGDVTLNGNSAEYIGCIYAQNIRKNGGKIHVVYSDEVNRVLPKTKVHLIK